MLLPFAEEAATFHARFSTASGHVERSAWPLDEEALSMLKGVGPRSALFERNKED